METPLELLKLARNAIESFRPDEAATYLTRFEAMVDAEQPPVVVRKRIAVELREIMGLSAAARDGVASARDQFNELIRLARSLDTYDREGTRLQKNSAGATIGRF